MKKIIFISFIAVVLAISFTMPAQAEKPIKIGFIHSLSGGVGQVYGVPDQAGVKIAVAEINAAGGILGRKLEVISRDDKLKPEVGVREVASVMVGDTYPLGQLRRRLQTETVQEHRDIHRQLGELPGCLLVGPLSE